MDQAVWAIPLPYQHPKPSHCTVISSCARHQLVTVWNIQLLLTDTVASFCMLGSWDISHYLLDLVFVNRLRNLKIWKTRKQWCPVKPRCLTLINVYRYIRSCRYNECATPDPIHWTYKQAVASPKPQLWYWICRPINLCFRKGGFMNSAWDFLSTNTITIR
jgi:hypothetical protein